MRFIADVNIAQTVITSLRKKGHNVIDLKTANRTTQDSEIIKLALQENRIVLTHDTDFLALTQYPQYQVPVILIRLRKQNANHFWEKLHDLIEQQSEELLATSLTILTEESADSYPY